MCNMFSFEKSVLKTLEEKIENILEWIIENEVNREEINIDNFYRECKEKKKELDETCKELEKQILNERILPSALDKEINNTDICSGSLLSDLFS